MNINVIGHVSKPGTFIIYEGTDLLTILSQAGGPLPGAKLNKIKIYRQNDEILILDLKTYLKTGSKIDVNFKPNDTIYVNQTLNSYMLSKSTILNSILTILNIYLAIDLTN
jgi:protein involved in polysaccharide export with SLBB domain